MKIGIDLRHLQRWDNRFRGIGCYIYNLVEHIVKLNSENNYVFFLEKSTGDNHVLDWIKSLSGRRNGTITLRELPSLRAVSLLDQIKLNRFIREEKVDCFHSPVQTSLPIFYRHRSVVTIHDLVQLRFPEMYLKGIGLRSKFRWAAKLFLTSRAAKLIAISENTKQDIIKYLKVPGHRIDVVYNGVNNQFVPLAKNSLLDGLKSRFHINGKFILYVGGFEERKNILRIFRAFHTFFKNGAKNVYLVIAGKIDAEGEQILKKMKAEHRDQNVIFTGFIGEDELVSLYNGCEFLIFPSIYEGFGLPALEAMACGKTLISSDTPSLKEVVGDAAICVNPYSEEEIALAISKLMSDIPFRRNLERKSFERAKLFSWKKAAEETLKVYEKVARL